MNFKPKTVKLIVILGLVVPVLATATIQGEGLPLGTPKFAVWRNDPRPLYHSKAPRGGPSYPDTVDLSCGSLEHEPDDDLTAPNNFGQDITFGRIYTTALAVAGKHEAGMTVGWRHTYSITAAASIPGTWSAVRFEDPKGATEDWIPVLKDGKPTGEFSLNPGAPFLVQGVPSSIPGTWESITWRMNGLAKWVFLPVGGGKANVYKLAQIFEDNGTSTTFKYDAQHDFRLKEIVDNAGKQMLALEYRPDGLLSSVVNSIGLSVFFRYANHAGFTCLTFVSPRSKGFDSREKIFWKYGYEAIRKQPFLSTVETPVQSPTSLSLHRNVFNPETGKQTSFIDANGNRAEFTYVGSTTNVKIFKGSGG
jgi:YD repeat-containing protein